MLEPDPNRYDPNTVAGVCAESARSTRTTLAHMDKAAYPMRAEALRAAVPLLDAAPDMYEALKHARAMIAVLNPPHCEAALAQYDAAITKAEGR